MRRARRAPAFPREQRRPATAQRGDVGVGDRRDRLGLLFSDPRGQRRQGGEPRPGLLRGRHPAAAWTSAGKSAADAPRSSSAVPTTTKSAPAARAARTWAALLIPPPTNSVRSGTAARQARITSARSEEHTSELQSQSNLVCRLLLEKKKKKKNSRLGQTQCAIVRYTVSSVK